MAVYIGEASKDENGNLHSGKLGNQNGQECRVVQWWGRTGDGRTWDWVARLKNRPDVSKAMGILMIEACQNQNVGYDQWQRETFTNACRAVGWKPKNVTTPCATDCSALVACILNCVQITVPRGMNTYSEEEALRNTGMFDFFTSAEYTQKPDNLQAGDILHMRGHTAMVVQNISSEQPVPVEKKEETQVGDRMWINWQYFESGKEYSDNSGWYIMGGHGNGAYGRYQFHYQYGLIPMLQFCVEQYPTLFSGFQPYIDLGAGNSQLANNSSLQALMKQYTEQHLAEFSQCQNWCMYNQYYMELRNNILKNMGYDVANIGSYAMGVVASLAIRNSGNWQSNASLFSGTTGAEDEVAWCNLVMAREATKVESAEHTRWLSTQPQRLSSDKNAQTGVIQIGQGSHVDNPDNPAPINPAGSSAGSAGTPEVVNPTTQPPEVGGLDAHNTFDPFWALRYFSSVLPFSKI